MSISLHAEYTRIYIIIYEKCDDIMPINVSNNSILSNLTCTTFTRHRVKSDKVCNLNSEQNIFGINT